MAGSPIDSLSIQISANARGANNSLSALAKNLEALDKALAGLDGSKLTSFASGVTAIGTAMQGLQGFGGKDFTDLKRNLEKFGKINSSQIGNVASTLRLLGSALNTVSGNIGSVAGISQLANAVSRLGGKTSETAIRNLPQLTTQLKNMMTSLANAPAVSNNLIRMTNAIANLASQGRSVGNAANTMNRALGGYNTSMIRARRSTFSLAAAFGRFYATYFLVIRAVKAMWKSVQTSMNYIETFNFWNVTMDKIGRDFVKNNGEYGEESAEAYADNFKKTLNKLNSKLTGYDIGEKGELAATGLANLGADSNQLLNFQARIGSVTNSVGLLGDTSVNTQKALSMLAYDLSSLTNIDVSSTMSNLQSGLQGMARSLYKYGIDITATTLKQLALEEGITKSVTNMTQQEKMQLRLLAILRGSKVAWGDMANTVNSVANQYRIMGQQWNNLTRTLGNLLLPVIRQVLPRINALIMSLNDLFNVLGFKLFGDSWLTDIMDGISSGAADIDDLGDETDDLSDDLDNATSSAKKLKQQLQGFDELNLLNTKEDSSGLTNIGEIDLSTNIADELANYESVWDQAFASMENKAMMFKKQFEKIFAGITKFFELVMSGNFKEAGKVLSNGVVDTLNALSSKIKEVDWEEIGKSIGKFLDGIEWTDIFTAGTNFISTLFDAAVDAWSGSFEAAPFETAVATALAICTFTGAGAIVANTLCTAIIAAIGGYNIGKKIGEKLIDEDLYKDFHWLGEGGFFDEVVNGFDSFGEAVKVNLDALCQTLESINIVEKITYALLSGMTGDNAYKNFKWFGEGGFFSEITDFDSIGEALKISFNAFLQTLETFNFAEKIAYTLMSALTGDNAYKDFKWFGEGGLFSELFGGYDSFGDWLNIQFGAIKEAGLDISNTIGDMCLKIADAIDGLYQKFEMNGPHAMYERFVRPLLEQRDISKWFDGLLENFNYNLTYMRNILISGLNNMITCVESFVNNLLSGYLPLLQVMSLIGDAVGFTIPSSIHFRRVPHFYNGGYPDGDLFYANEFGVPELVGTVNGNTAVASGHEITGISDAVYSTGETQASLLSTCVSLLQIISEKEFGISDSDIAKSIVRSNKESINRTGKALV